jgi:hypothetical protein
MEWHGSTVVPNSVQRFDTAGDSLYGKRSPNSGWNSDAGLLNKKLLIQTTTLAKVNTIHPVMLDLAHGASFIPAPNNKLEPKEMHGTTN